MLPTNQPIARAFVSCSLREEDKAFIQLVESIIEDHNIEPFGTVGKYSISPVNPAQHMRENIPLADLVVIIATPRYIQTDIQTGQQSFGLSEMVHVETGMAYMAHKSVVVFVQEGTSVGNFLPNITQYIILNGKENDIHEKWNLINSLFYNAWKIIQSIRSSKSNKQLLNLVKTGLAIWGGVKLFESLSEDEKPKRRKKIK